MRDKSKGVGGRRKQAKVTKGPVGSASRGKLVKAPNGRIGYIAGKCRNKEG